MMKTYFSVLLLFISFPLICGDLTDSNIPDSLLKQYEAAIQSQFQKDSRLKTTSNLWPDSNSKEYLIFADSLDQWNEKRKKKRPVALLYRPFLGTTFQVNGVAVRNLFVKRIINQLMQYADMYQLSLLVDPSERNPCTEEDCTLIHDPEIQMEEIHQIGLFAAEALFDPAYFKEATCHYLLRLYFPIVFQDKRFYFEDVENMLEKNILHDLENRNNKNSCLTQFPVVLFALKNFNRAPKPETLKALEATAKGTDALSIAANILLGHWGNPEAWGTIQKNLAETLKGKYSESACDELIVKLSLLAYFREIQSTDILIEFYCTPGLEDGKWENAYYFLRNNLEQIFSISALSPSPFFPQTIGEWWKKHKKDPSFTVLKSRSDQMIYILNRLGLSSF